MLRLILVLYIVTVGFTMIFIVPPLQKPDEGTHFLQALRIKQGHITCSSDNHTTYIRKDYYELLNNPTLQSLQFHTERKIPISFYTNPFFTKNNQEQLPVDTSVVCTFPIISYLPYIPIITFGELFHLNAITIFFLGRFFMFVFVSMWFYLLFRKTLEPWKWIIAFVFMLPMTLHQMSSYSYDAVHIMFGLSLFSFFIQIYYEKSIRSLFRYIGVLTLFFLARPGGYEPLLFTLFLVPRKLLHEAFHKHKFVMGIVLICTFLAIISSKLFLHEYTLMNNSLQSLIQTRIEYLQQYPFSFIITLWNTSKILFFPYIMGAIGLFGWLEYGLPHYVYLIYILIALCLIFYCAFHQTQNMLSTRKQILLGLILFFGYCLIHFILYLSWPKSLYFIEGVQGRYFIAFIPFLLLLFSQLLNRFSIKNNTKHTFFVNNILHVLSFVIIFLIIIIVRTIALRYFLL